MVIALVQRLAQVHVSGGSGAELERDGLLEEIMREFYETIKRSVPGGGADGRDPDERNALGKVLTAAVEHTD